MYKFRIAEDDERKAVKGNYSGNWIYGTTPPNGEKAYALFLGKMISRFGKNDSFSDDWETMYSYWIVAEDENGQKALIEIYHGSGGSSYSIPTSYDNESERELYDTAVKELLEYIESAVPEDYEWESVYADIPANVKYIVKDGVANVESTFGEFDGDFDPEDFM